VASRAACGSDRGSNERVGGRLRAHRRDPAQRVRHSTEWCKGQNPQVDGAPASLEML